MFVASSSGLYCSITQLYVLSMSNSFTYEYTTVIFSLHVMLYPGVDHLIKAAYN